MINEKTHKTVLKINKEATFLRIKERTNELKKKHIAAKGTSRNNPVKQSKTATLNCIYRLFLRNIDPKKRYTPSQSPALATSHTRLGSANDASGRTMSRHLQALIELGLLRGLARMQRGIQILLEPSLIVWEDVPMKQWPAPANHRLANPPTKAGNSPAVSTSAPPPSNTPSSMAELATTAILSLRAKFSQSTLATS